MPRLQDRTQDPQYSKIAVSKTAVLKNRSSYIMIVKKKLLTKNVENCLNLSNHPLKSFYNLCVSRGTLKKMMTMV